MVEIHEYKDDRQVGTVFVVAIRKDSGARKGSPTGGPFCCSFNRRPKIHFMSDKNMTTNTLKKCPFCAEEIKIEAIRCKHCKKMLNENRPTPSNTIDNKKPETKQVAYLGSWVFVFFLSFGTIKDYFIRDYENFTIGAILIITFFPLWYILIEQKYGYKVKNIHKIILAAASLFVNFAIRAL